MSLLLLFFGNSQETTNVYRASSSIFISYHFLDRTSRVYVAYSRQHISCATCVSLNKYFFLIISIVYDARFQSKQTTIEIPMKYLQDGIGQYIGYSIFTMCANGIFYVDESMKYTFYEMFPSILTFVSFHNTFSKTTNQQP